MLWERFKLNKIDSIFIGLVIGPVFPILLFLSGWWGSLSFVADNRVFIIAFVGLGIGLGIEVIYLRAWIRYFYDTSIPKVFPIYMFYTICVFGFFMGVPIFNLIPGTIAGIYIGRRLRYFKIEGQKHLTTIEKTSKLTATTMLFVSTASAYFALSDPFTAGNLQGMLRLPFKVTEQMIIELIVFGGMALVVLQYWLTKKAAIFAYRHCELK